MQSKGYLESRIMWNCWLQFWVWVDLADEWHIDALCGYNSISTLWILFYRIYTYHILFKCSETFPPQECLWYRIKLLFYFIFCRCHFVIVYIWIQSNSLQRAYLWEKLWVVSWKLSPAPSCWTSPNTDGCTSNTKRLISLDSSCVWGAICIWNTCNMVGILLILLIKRIKFCNFWTFHW